MGLPIMKMGPAGVQNVIILNHPFNRCRHVTRKDTARNVISTIDITVCKYLFSVTKRGIAMQKLNNVKTSVGKNIGSLCTNKA